MLAIQHVFESLAADIAIARTINCIANGHVISGHTLGYCAGCATDAEEPTNHFLPSTDLSKGSITAWVKIDGQSLALCVWTFNTGLFNRHIW